MPRVRGAGMQERADRSDASWLGDDLQMLGKKGKGSQSGERDGGGGGDDMA